MKRTPALQTAFRHDVCLLCLSRLQSRTFVTPRTLRRSFANSKRPQQSQSEAVAEVETKPLNATQQSQQSSRPKWGRMRQQQNASSQPGAQPSTQDATPRSLWGAYRYTGPSGQQIQSAPDIGGIGSDGERAQFETTPRQPSEPYRLRQAPVLDEPAQRPSMPDHNIRADHDLRKVPVSLHIRQEQPQEAPEGFKISRVRFGNAPRSRQTFDGWEISDTSERYQRSLRSSRGQSVKRTPSGSAAAHSSSGPDPSIKPQKSAVHAPTPNPVRNQIAEKKVAGGEDRAYGASWSSTWPQLKRNSTTAPRQGFTAIERQLAQDKTTKPTAEADNAPDWAASMKDEQPQSPKRGFDAVERQMLQDKLSQKNAEPDVTPDWYSSINDRFTDFVGFQPDRQRAYNQPGPSDSSKRSDPGAQIRERNMLPQARGNPRPRQAKHDRSPKLESAPVRFTRTEEFERASLSPKPQSRGRELSGRRAEKFAPEDDDSMSHDFEEFQSVSKLERKRQRKREKTASRASARPTPIELPPFISVSNLARALKVYPEDFVDKLKNLGYKDATMDYVLNAENAGLVAQEFNFEPIPDQGDERDLKPRPQPEGDRTLLRQRPPIVTIMGHVDHGKTTILDHLRKSSVAASEFGGITQHIGAFSVSMASGRVITFLDTPGHSAFLAMRQRGANVTDIVILVVAADDSVKPQTVEAIRHARNANVPIIVAINKVDKDEADTERVKQDLLRHEVTVEDYGGDIQAVPVSGKTGQGLSDLEEATVTLAELLDLRAENDGPAEGTVLEAATKKAGRVATVLVRRGTLQRGNIIVAGTTWARVRSLRNEAGATVQSAGPGTPVEVDGWRDQPFAGDKVLEASEEAKATDVVKYRKERAERAQESADVEAINEERRTYNERYALSREAGFTARKEAKSENLRRAHVHAATKRARETSMRDMEKEQSDLEREEALSENREKTTTLYLIVKADVSGSVEAVTTAMQSLPLANQPVKLSILRSGVGPVSESDLDLAAAAVPSPAQQSNSPTSIIMSFNQDIPHAMSSACERAGVRAVSERIIYKVIDSVRELVESHLPPIVESRVVGEVECLQVFEVKVRSGAKGQSVKVAGCRVKNGTVTRNVKVRVYRGGVGGNLVYEGSLASLKNQKKDVTEMRKGAECGVGFDGWESFEAGDVIQCYEVTQQRRKLPA